MPGRLREKRRLRASGYLCYFAPKAALLGDGLCRSVVGCSELGVSMDNVRFTTGVMSPETVLRI